MRLRHVIAIAELMGLPKIVQVAHLNNATEVVDDEGHICRAQLWDLICAADRLLGMVLNLPPDTSRHQRITTRSLSIDGVVQSQAYLHRLTDIANRIQYLDDLNTLHGPSTELYTSAFKLAGELKVLASQTPESWWAWDVRDVQAAEPDHLVQFLHYYVTMRVHLPFTMRQDPGGQYSDSRLACIDACESLVQRYRFLGRRLPPGFFLSEMLDLQAFTAAVILLLISRIPSSVHFMNMGIDKARIKNEVGEVIHLMHERSHSTPGSGFAHDGVATLCSLDNLLQESENGVDLGQSALKVPLLGKVHIRRNAHSSQETRVDSPWSFQTLSGLGACNTNEQSFPLSLDTNLSIGSAYDAQNLLWDGLAYCTPDIHDTLY